jgi:hypothetical protein
MPFPTFEEIKVVAAQLEVFVSALLTAGEIHGMDPG